LLVARWRDAEALAIGLGVGSIGTAGLALASSLELGPVTFSRSALRSLFSFSSQVSVQNFVYFGVNTAPTWWVSRAAGAAPLGQFSRANLIVGLPLTQLAAGSSKALYPAYAHLQNDLARTRAAVTDALVAVSGLAALLFAGLAGCSPILVPLLLGDGWKQATGLVPAFALVAVFNIVFVVLANAFEARAMLRVAWRVQAVLVGALVMSLVAAAALSAPLALVALSLAFAYAAAHSYQLAQAVRAELVDRSRLLRAYVVHAIAAGVFGLGLWLTATTTLPEGLTLSLITTTGIGVTGLALLWSLRRRLPAYSCIHGRNLFARRARAFEPVA
jgi:O-antigen/teichoic acid export membrane protein